MIEDYKGKPDLKTVFDILRNTIGVDLSQTKAMSGEEYKKWDVENERRRKEWDKDHPEQAAKRDAWNKKYSSKKEHILTSKERELVKELLKIDDSTIDTMSTYIFEDGDICIRTPQHTWTSLCGREWTVNIKDKTINLTAMN